MKHVFVVAVLLVCVACVGGDPVLEGWRCQRDADCGTAQQYRCDIQNRCRARCKVQADCPAGRSCVNGTLCLPIEAVAASEPAAEDARDASGPSDRAPPETYKQPTDDAQTPDDATTDPTGCQPKKEECNGLDDDCDGEVDEDIPPISCKSSSTSGECQKGTRRCIQGSLQCVHLQPTAEVCDGLDNDCDGQTDEGISQGGSCDVPGLKGPCARGTLSCVKGQESCVAVVKPQPREQCSNGIDDDCNGKIDDGCVCDTGHKQACFDGPSQKKGVGICKAGIQICQGNSWGSCQGQVLPGAEVCDGLDNDCDGLTDNSPLTRGPLARACYTGPASTRGVGECKGGSQLCLRGSWSKHCNKQVPPQVETCNGKDDDCDGSTDESDPQIGAKCTLSNKKGNCAVGAFSCRRGQLVCTQKRMPSNEVCDNQDNDCDGKTDEDLIRSCYTGPPGSRGVGNCRSGTQICTAGNWGPCTGQSLPQPEKCDGKDTNCDGKSDVCQKGQTRCSGQWSEVCNKTCEGWSSAEKCGVFGCLNGRCCRCTPGARSCSNTTTVAICRPDCMTTATNQICKPPEICDNGVCQPR